MILTPTIVQQLQQGYRSIETYYRELRRLFEVIDIRFRIAEYGVRLRSIPSNRLFSNASGFALDDRSEYPYYLWTPSWLGRFYLDPARLAPGVEAEDCTGREARYLAFVWAWVGLGDAYVADVEQPECWIGVTEPDPADPAQSVLDVASSIWNFFRVETTASGEAEGWIHGRFYENEIGCRLRGRWELRRLPMSALTSFYQVEKLIVRPLGTRFYELSRGTAKDRGHLAAVRAESDAARHGGP